MKTIALMTLLASVPTYAETFNCHPDKYSGTIEISNGEAKLVNWGGDPGTKGPFSARMEKDGRWTIDYFNGSKIQGKISLVPLSDNVFQYYIDDIKLAIQCRKR